jgi:hypothetical protein
MDIDNDGKSDNWFLFRVGLIILVLIFIVVGGIFGFIALSRAFGRNQALADERNQITINEIRIAQQEQLIKVEQQKADIRVAEARGIAESQKIINATLTDKYLQHEAIDAQKHLADSPNHTTIYIPSGQNGIPLVKTVDDIATQSSSSK